MSKVPPSAWRRSCDGLPRWLRGQGREHRINTGTCSHCLVQAGGEVHCQQRQGKELHIHRVSRPFVRLDTRQVTNDPGNEARRGCRELRCPNRKSQPATLVGELSCQEGKCIKYCHPRAKLALVCLRKTPSGANRRAAPRDKTEER